MASYKQVYGLDWPVETPKHQIELSCARFHRLPEYRAGNLLPPEEHMIRAIEKLLPPPYYVIHPWAEKIIWAWCNHNLVVLMGPASSSKSHTTGLISVLDWIVAPRTTSTFFASTTKAALERRSWSSILQYFQLLKRKGCTGVISKSRTAIINEEDKEADDGDYDVKNGIFGVAVLQGTLQDALSNLVGVHQPDRYGGVRMFADEAQAVKQAFINARFNLSIGTPDFRIVLMGNPMDLEDALGNMAKPVDGWDSVTIDTEEWETASGGVCLHFDGLKSPAIEHPDKFPFLINQSQIDSVLRQNENNPLAPDYLTMCRGWVSSGMEADIVLPRSYVQRFGMNSQEYVWEGDPTPIAALDPAFSSGGDKAILQIAYVGMLVSGEVALVFGDTIPLHISDDPNMPVTYQLSGQIQVKAETYGLSPGLFACDETGTQQVSDVLEMEWGRGILRKMFNGKPTKLPVSHLNETPADEFYRNAVTEMWYNVRQFGVCGQVRALPGQAVKEFGMRKVLPKRPKVLESKEDMKKRLGHSPDVGDACALVTAVARELLNLVPGSNKYEPGGLVAMTTFPDELVRYHNEMSSPGSYDYQPF